MKQATLTQPFVTAQPAVRIKLLGFSGDAKTGAVSIALQYIDAQGAVVQTRHMTFATPEAIAWVATQETTILNYLLSQLGVTGTVGDAP